MSNPEDELDDVPCPSDEAVAGGASKMGQRRSSVKNLIKLFQPISQEEKMARLAGNPTETNPTPKTAIPASRNINGSVRYAHKFEIRPFCSDFAFFSSQCLFTTLQSKFQHLILFFFISTELRLSQPTLRPLKRKLRTLQLS